MKYQNGQAAQVGDRVKIGLHDQGIVVCSIDSGEGTPEYPISQWSYLKIGVMILTSKGALIHYSEPDEDLELIQRA